MLGPPMMPCVFPLMFWIITCKTPPKESHKIAQGLSNYVTLAWATLRDPLPRAEYILKLQGIEIAEEDQLEDFELISEILEVREKLETAAPNERQQILDENHGVWVSLRAIEESDLVWLSGEIIKICEDIEKFIGEQDWAKAKTATVKLKYLDGIKRAASEWRPEL
jgi:molecular chaperone HscB